MGQSTQVVLPHWLPGRIRDCEQGSQGEVLDQRSEGEVERLTMEKVNELAEWRGGPYHTQVLSPDWRNAPSIQGRCCPIHGLCGLRAEQLEACRSTGTSGFANVVEVVPSDEDTIHLMAHWEITQIEHLDNYGEGVRDMDALYGPRVRGLIYQADVKMRTDDGEDQEDP
eukprot:4778982-Amphidinium_carterae.2